MRFKILVTEFPYGNAVAPSASKWVGETMHRLVGDPRCEKAHHLAFDDTPITMTRNLAVKAAQELGCDFLLMVDSDMAPDAYPERPLAKPFVASSLDFMLNVHREPCVVAAPYGGPPPHEQPYIFQWANYRSHNPNADLRLQMMSREECANRSGIERVAALPTGVCLFSVAGFERIAKPYFAYEWKDESHTEKASTEDVYTTRNLSMAGVECFCNWDAWAGHWKRVLVGPPTLLTPADVRQMMTDAAHRLPPNERVTFLNGSNGAGNRLFTRGVPGVKTAAASVPNELDPAWQALSPEQKAAYRDKLAASLTGR